MRLGYIQRGSVFRDCRELCSLLHKMGEIPDGPNTELSITMPSPYMISSQTASVTCRLPLADRSLHEVHPWRQVMVFDNLHLRVKTGVSSRRTRRSGRGVRVWRAMGGGSEVMMVVMANPIEQTEDGDILVLALVVSTGRDG